MTGGQKLDACHEYPSLPVAALVLAAGSSTRFGRDKLATNILGQPMVRHIVELLSRVRSLTPIHVVVRPGFTYGLAGEQCRLVDNPSHANGLSSSLQCGLKSLTATGAQAVLICLGDQPFLTPMVGERLIQAWRLHPARPVRAAYDGQLRNPVVLPRTLWNLADTVEGDQGLGALLQSEAVECVECADVGHPHDIDEPHDQWTNAAALHHLNDDA